VDRLLGSKEFGERWGRHWLDVARYADSNGSDENFTYYDAWRFRNYAIDAFNKDKPFDQFVREQIAGDLLPSAHQKQRDEQITATGFLVLGPKVIGDDDKEQLRMDVIDEQIDTVGKAFLGLSLGCARCHDHKFDPVPTKDYYALAGIFGSTETVHGNLLHRRDLSGWNLRPLGQDGDKLYREWKAYDDKLDALKKKQEQSKSEVASLKKKVEEGRARHSVRAVSEGGGQAQRAPSDTPYQPPSRRKPKSPTSNGCSNRWPPKSSNSPRNLCPNRPWPWRCAIAMRLLTPGSSSEETCIGRAKSCRAVSFKWQTTEGIPTLPRHKAGVWNWRNGWSLLEIH
jgi:hypothetical protein